jgi:hypothetical protein
VSIPVDFDAPTPADLDVFIAALDSRAGQKVHVHCAANYRVSAFVSLYARRAGWCSDAEADEIAREFWDPSEHPAWAAFLTDERARARP